MCKERTCGTCAIKQLQGGMCPVFKREVSDDDKGCIIHTTELSKCDFCGRVAFGTLVISPTDDGKYRYVCEECCSLFGTCRTCEYGVNNCEFETNPSTLPKLVQKEFRQGPMVSIAQVRNPERIEITCRELCECWDDDFGCLRENGTCGNWKEF